MNQSARTLAYHLAAMQIVTRLVEARQRHDLAEFPDRLNREHDPTQEAERVELRCPICGHLKCPWDVRKEI